MSLSNARLFIHFSSEGGNALDVIKIISISTPVSASTRGHATIADCHMRGGSVGCRREARLHLCLINSLISKVVILERRVVWITHMYGHQLEMEERVGSQVRRVSLRPSGELE